MQFAADNTLPPSTAPLDWAAVKAQILAGLDLGAEFTALGVEFTREDMKSNGIRECHAIGRQDAEPSAFCNLRTGVYHDSGGEGLTLGFFDFALRFGGHGRWIDVLKHYAARAGVAIGHVAASKGGRVKEAEYLYRQADGAIAFKVTRWRQPNGKKTFSQAGPDGRGGWKYGEGAMDGVEPVPYRLPEVLASEALDDTVWIVEGEKDADRLTSLGLTATTNSQGAQSSSLWERFAPHFVGRDAVILPDNDPGGRSHAAKVAGYLRGVVRSLKVVELPGLPLKGDVSDWLDQGHELDELGRLAGSTPEWQPGMVPAVNAPGDGNPDRDATVADLRLTLSDDAWAWTGWIMRGALILLAAEPGTGKTRFCFDLHRRIVQGLPWPDGSPMTLPRDSKVLWVAADSQWQELADIPATFGIPDELVVLNATASDPYDGTSLQAIEELDDFDARIGRVKPALVFIDSITNSGDFKSQDSSDAKRQYKPLQEIAARHNVPILCVTHLNSGGKVLGRRALEKVRVAIQLDCPDPDGQPNRRRLWVEKSKAIKPPKLGVSMGDQGNEYDEHPPIPPAPDRLNGARHGPPPTKVAECMAWLAQRLSLGKSRVTQIRKEADEAGFASGTLYRARDQLGVHEERVDDKFLFWELVDGQENGHANGLGNGRANGHAPPRIDDDRPF